MQQVKLNIGVVGYGYWSPKVVQGFIRTGDACIYAICEKDEAKHAVIRAEVPGVTVYRKFEEMLQDPKVEAVIITTTVSSHYRIAKAALMADKHVLVEKPMTEDVWQADELISLAKAKNKTLMVDHTFLFMPAIQELKKIIDGGELGKVHTVLGNRSNLGLFQKDVDVLIDLAPHDFSIIYYLFNEEPNKITSIGTAPIKHKYHTKKYNGVACTSLQYKSGLFVHFIHSWLAPIKDRRMIFIGDKKMAVFDMLDKEGSLKIYDTSVDVLHDADPYGTWFSYAQNGYRVVDLPQLPGDDIQRMAQEFVDAIRQNREPITSGFLGKVVVKNLSMARGSNIFTKIHDQTKKIFKKLKK